MQIPYGLRDQTPKLWQGKSLLSPEKRNTVLTLEGRNLVRTMTIPGVKVELVTDRSFSYIMAFNHSESLNL